MSRLSERIENYNSAFDIFSDVVKAYNSNPDYVVNHMAIVQAYEVCFELSWKVLKDYLSQNGILLNLPKEVIKESFANDIITDGQLWIEMLEARNATSHEYKIVKVRNILNLIATKYYLELKEFKNSKAFNE